jgi:hypothetical protein
MNRSGEQKYLPIILNILILILKAIVFYKVIITLSSAVLIRDISAFSVLNLYYSSVTLCSGTFSNNLPTASLLAWL